MLWHEKQEIRRRPAGRKGAAVRNFWDSLYWYRVFAAHLIAFSIVAMCIALPFGGNGFLSGYIGWAVVLSMLMFQMDDETRDALKRWAVRKGGRE